MKEGCRACRGQAATFDFVVAFQPILDLEHQTVWGYEALVRGPEGQSAASVLDSVTDENRYHFDQACRVKAIETAGRLFPSRDLRLSINFLPNAVYEPAACIRTSLAAADRIGLSRDQIMFEFTENERIVDAAKIISIIAEYRRCGFITAVDDFGSGFSGLNRLAAFQPDLLKLDMELIRGVDASRSRRVIVAGVVAITRALGIEVLAEGVETRAELDTLRAMGIELFQGYLFARPMIETLPAVAGFPSDARARDAA